MEEQELRCQLPAVCDSDTGLLQTCSACSYLAGDADELRWFCIQECKAAAEGSVFVSSSPSALNSTRQFSVLTADG